MQKTYKVIGYGVCGAGESSRYMRATLEEFKRLCDHTVIVGNNITADDRMIISEYGFELIEDSRTWGQEQHHIKQDLMYYLARYEPKYLVALDMDEVFDPQFDKDALIEHLDKYNALYFYIVNLWGEGWNRKWSFWNIRAWKWNGDTKILNKPLHCGLAPEWCYYYAAYSPFFVKHYGLMKKEDRQKKIERYEKYDPHAKYKDRSYYLALAQDAFEKLDEDFIRAAIKKEIGVQVARKIKTPVPKKFFYVKTPQGKVIDIPEAHLEETLKRGGFTLVGEVGKMP